MPTKRTTSTSTHLPVKIIVIIVLISILLAVGWRLYRKQQEKHVQTSLAFDLANCRSLWTQKRFEDASIAAKEIARIYETLLTAGERNNIAICLWDGKQFGEALKQFVYAYRQQPNFITLDNLLGCWRESKNFVLLDPVATPLMMEYLYREAMKVDTKWSPYIRTVASSCLFQHGYYQFAAALCSVLINKELYEFEEMKYDLYQNWALSEFYNGDWEAATPKLIASSHRLVYKWNPNFLKSSSRNPYKVYNIFEGIAGLHNVKATNVSTPDDLYRTIAVPVTNELHCSSTEFRYRDTYIVEYANIQFENLGLLHNDENEFFLYDVGWYPFLKHYTDYLAPPLTKIYVETGIFLTPWTDNYYHWTAESISRLLLLQDQGFFKEHPDAKVFVSNHRFIKESLDAIGFPKENRVFFDGGKHQVVADRLYAIINNPWGHLGAECMHHQMPPVRALRLMNQFFRSNVSGTSKKVIYIPRSGNVARATKFDDIFVPTMKEMLGDQFVLHDPSKPFLVQVEMFNNACLIIGAHGAGLSNMIFSPPGTGIIELPAQEAHLHLFFSHIAAALGMSYWSIPEISSSYFSYYPSTQTTVDTLVNAVQDAMLHCCNRLK